MEDRFSFRAWHKDIGMKYDVCPEYSCDNLMQCTGLRDKNNKLIFEGDIVLYEDDMCEIYFDKTGACHYISNNRDDQYDFLAQFCMAISKACQIIGNVYENPELLKGRQTPS